MGLIERKDGKMRRIHTDEELQVVTL
jgi:hypothetical protein